MEISYSLQGFFVLLVLLLFTLLLFNDTVKGCLEIIGIQMRSLYNRASTNLGLSTFNESELTESEKARNVKKFRNAHVGGLYNEGNTCFMNSVIQALASCRPIAEFVDEYKDELNFSGSLHDTVLNLNQIHTRRHGYSTMKLVSQIEGAKRWTSYHQEDAQEFFQELLNSLEKDKKAQVKQSSEDEKKVWKRVTPFDGQFAVRVGCLQCGDMEGIRPGVISSVDLSLESNFSRVSLHDLLKNYTAMETISGVECYRCSLLKLKEELQERIDACNVPTLQSALNSRMNEVDGILKEKVIDDKVYGRISFASFKVQTDKTKQTMFAKPHPDTLMIHINRSVFDLNLGIIRKNSASVDFPSVLDIAPYTCDPEDPKNADPRIAMKGMAPGSDDLYDLKAAVIHYGSANFGHYICFRKFHGFWWRISDDNVDLTTEAQVLGTQGVFMLFYERRGAAKTSELPIDNLILSKSEATEENNSDSDSSESSSGGNSLDESDEAGSRSPNVNQSSSRSEGSYQSNGISHKWSSTKL